MDVPDRWTDYPCQEYFSSHFANEGYWDESAQLWLIESAGQVEEDAVAGFLQVGRPGVDSIGFGYRKGQAGFWAYHRMIDRRFQFLAPTIQRFLDDWSAGRIQV